MGFGFFRKSRDKTALERAEELLERINELDKALSMDYERYKRELAREFNEYMDGLKEAEESAIHHLWNEATKAQKQNEDELDRMASEWTGKLTKSFKETMRHVKILRNEVAETANRLKEVESEIKNLKNEVSSAKVTIQKLSAGPKSQNAKIDALNSHLKTLEEQVKGLEAELKSLRDENRELREFVEASLREMKEMKRQIEVLMEGSG